MKKKYLLIMLLILMFLFTGCSKAKKMTCTKEEKTDYLTKNTNIEVEYDKEKITKIKATVTEKTDRDTASLNENIYKVSFIQYNAVEGITAQSTLSDDYTVKYEITIDKNNLDVDSYNNLYNTTTTKTFLTEDLKDELKIEDYKNNDLEGFECK